MKREAYKELIKAQIMAYTIPSDNLAARLLPHAKSYALCDAILHTLQRNGFNNMSDQALLARRERTTS